jgi:hypothetical protein
VLLYDCAWPFPDPLPEGRSVRWDLGGSPGSEITAVPWMDGRDGSVRVAPMLDHCHLVGICGRVTRPTAGVLWDPHSEDGEALSECASGLAGAMPASHRLVVTADPSFPVRRPEAGAEVAEEGWRIGFDWMFGSLCSAVVCDGGCRRYPFMLASCMAMGKACVALCPEGLPRPGFARHAVTCLVASSPGEAASMASWLLEDRNSGKAQRLGAAARAASASEDKDAAMAALRGVLL